MVRDTKLMSASQAIFGVTLTFLLAVTAGCGDAEPKFQFPDKPVPAKTREELHKAQMSSSQGADNGPAGENKPNTN